MLEETRFVQLIKGRIANAPGPNLLTLTRPSRIDRRISEVTSNVGQRACHSLEHRRVDGIEEVAPNTCEVNRPCGSHFCHSSRSNPRNVPTPVSGTRRLRHQTAYLEVVHQSRRPAGRQAGSAGEVRHAQLAIGRFGEVHDCRVLARRQTRASHEIAVQKSWKDLYDPHHGAPQLFFAGREWFNRSHPSRITCLAKQVIDPGVMEVIDRHLRE